ncbi:gp71 [Rhodococcus phage ReqiPine5]|uniref:Gp71 n=1 Tax=Rhodococcus phage ReqiPine5 TaxID=691963 RepID=D4P846_9CAUD|nr:gp71 [Rhodococcus phage ReqiPine5]ADD81176.1 gp71 [Rhodococcus phage ReqiPine5]
MTSIRFGDVRKGDEIAVIGVRVRVDRIEPHFVHEDDVIVHYRGEDGTQRNVTRHSNEETTLYDRPTVDEEDVIGASSDPKPTLVQWKNVHKGDRVEVAHRGVCEVLNVTRPSKGQVVITVLDSEGKAHVEERSSVLTTEMYSWPTEDLDEEVGEKAELEESPEVVLAGSLTARYLEHPITFRYDSTQGFDTTIHAARLVGYSVNLEDVRLYLVNEQDVHVPIKVTYDQVLTIHPKTPE